ncbi:MAG: hypothetical protein ACTSXQ_07455, partial [Alphaproteobacteria bacterium]
IKKRIESISALLNCKCVTTPINMALSLFILLLAVIFYGITPDFRPENMRVIEFLYGGALQSIFLFTAIYLILAMIPLLLQIFMGQHLLGKLSNTCATPQKKKNK